MASSPDRTRIVLLAAAALVASSVLWFFGTGMRPLWWLTWLAALPILLIAPRVSGLAAFGLATLSWFAGTLNMWRYLRNVLAPPAGSPLSHHVMPVAVTMGVLIVPSCLFGLAVLLTRAALRRNSAWRACLALPAFWVTYEHLTAVLSPHSTFGNLAYTQMDCLPVLQLASVFGVSGITFSLFLLPATLAVLLRPGTRRSALAARVGLFFVATLGFGWWRLRSTPASEPSVVVGLAASDLSQNVFPEEAPEKVGRLFREYAEQAAAVAAQGAQVIVFPEKLAVVVDPQTSETDALFQAAASSAKADIVVGVIRVTPTARLNEARLYSGTGASPVAYDKHHMLPAFESSFQPGTTQTVLPRPSGLWGLAICKDMDFPALSREYGRAGVGLLLVPAWDFGDDGWLHDRMAVMRGVESGFSIARAAKEGLLTVSDDRGRLLAERRTDGAPFVSLSATVPVRNSSTLYARWGDWFAWLNILALVVIVASLRFGR